MADGPIERNPDVMSGAPVFAGTRVPVQIFIEYLEDGASLDVFLECFPTVSRNQAIEVLERAKASLIGEPGEAAA